jgi:hypothetical protein
MTGIYYLPVEYPIIDAGFNKRVVINGLDRFETDKKISYCQSCEHIWIKNHIFYTNINNANLKKGLLNQWLKIPENFTFWDELIPIIHRQMKRLKVYDLPKVIIEKFEERLKLKFDKSGTAVQGRFNGGSTGVEPKEKGKSKKEKGKRDTKVSSVRNDKIVSDRKAVFADIPLKSNKHEEKFFSVDDEMIKSYEQDFPGLDVKQCVRDIRRWNTENPERRKTEKGIRRHIASWLIRANDKGQHVKKHQESSQTWVPDRGTYGQR